MQGTESFFQHPQSTWRGASPQARFTRPDRRGATAPTLDDVTRHVPLLARGLTFSISEGQAAEEVVAREATYRRLLGLADLFAAATALLIVQLLTSVTLHSAAPLLALPLVVLVSKVVGAYDRDELVLQKNTLDEAPLLLQLATGYVLLAVVTAPYLADLTPSPLQIVTVWAAMIVLLLVSRTAARRLARHLSPPERCMVVGTEAASRRIRTRLEESTRVNADVVAHLPFQPKRAGDGKDWRMDDVQEIMERLQVHRVLVAPSGQENEEVLEFIRIAKALGLRVSVVPRMFEVVGSSVVFDDVDGVTVLGVRQFGLGRSSERIKRGFDLLVAGVATLLLSPVMALAAVAIRLEDCKGPVLFRQTRVGRGGKRFEVLKFRTMCVDAEAKKADLQHLNEADGLFKITDDPRITRVGRILRKTSLDELPQLLNVLRGEMSVVGPRPFIVEDDDKIQGWHRRRLHLTPGMTGHWQILGSNRIPLHEMVTIDYLYVANWSLWTDLKILLRTVPYVLSARSS